jgi:hypothetical protein
MKLAGDFRQHLKNFASSNLINEMAPFPEGGFACPLFEWSVPKLDDKKPLTGVMILQDWELLKKTRS